MKMSWHLVAAFLLAGAVPALGQAEVSYRFVEIPMAESMSDYNLTGLNIHNQVIGFATYPDAVDYMPEAFVWSQTGGYTTMNIPAGATGTVALDINDHGVVVGRVNANPSTAFVWSEVDGLQVLPTIESHQWDFAANDLRQSALGITNSGVIAMEASTVAGNYKYGFLWSESTGIQTLGESLQSYEFLSIHDINENHTVIGYVKSDLSDTATQDGFVWNEESGFQRFSDLVGQPADLWYLNAINDQGVIVGDYNEPGPGDPRAMVWCEVSGLEILGVLGEGHDYSTLLDINNSGVAIGYSTVNGPGQTTPANTLAGIWDASNGFRELAPLVTNIEEDWLLWRTAGINERGVILARIYDTSAGFEREGLLIPFTDITGDIDADGFVGVSDLDMLLAYWGTADFLADADGSGLVDEADLNLVLTNWGAGTVPGSSVPEPASLMLLVLGGLASVRRRRVAG